MKRYLKLVRSQNDAGGETEQINEWVDSGNFQIHSIEHSERYWVILYSAPTEAAWEASSQADTQELREKYKEETTSSHGIEELLVAIRSDIDALPRDDRHLISMYFVAGLSQSEMSEELKISQATISLRLKKVIQQLKSNLTLLSEAITIRETITIRKTISSALQQKT